MLLLITANDLKQGSVDDILNGKLLLSRYCPDFCHSIYIGKESHTSQFIGLSFSFRFARTANLSGRVFKTDVKNLHIFCL